MEKKLFDKKCNNAVKKIMKGSKDYWYYIIDTEEKSFSTFDKNIIPHTLIVFWEIGDKKIVKGFYNNKAIETFTEEEKDEEIVNMILNIKDKMEMEVIISYKDMNEIYNKGFNENEKHKLIVFQENQFFTECIIYDSQLSNPPSHILFTEELTREHLKNFTLAILGSCSENIYEIVMKDEE